MKRVFTVIALMVLSCGFARSANAAAVFYDNDLAGFNTVVAGQTLIGTEDFESSTLGPGGVSLVSNPLTQGVANGPFPSGVSVPVTFQSNALGGAPVTPSSGIFFGTGAAGYAFATSDFVGTAVATHSLDLIFSASDEVTAVAFSPTATAAPDVIEVRVYDTSDTLIDSTTTSLASILATTHFGVQTDGGDIIGRINIFAPGGAGAGLDNLSLFTHSAVPEPASAGLLLLGTIGMLGRPRRRRAM